MNDNVARHAYLILVHDRPEQLNKLLSLLDHERNDIYVHIDRKSAMTADEIGQDINKSKLEIYKEVSAYWSDVSLTESELFILDKAMANGPYMYYHLLSGSDLPIKSQDYILEFFDGNKGKEFVEYQIPGRFLDKPYYERIKYYHVLVRHYRHKGFWGGLFSWICIGIEYVAIFFQFLFRVNRIPENMEFARGSQWFDISQELAEYVMTKRSWIMEQFRMTRASDESFLPLLVHNSEFKERLYKKSFDGDMHGNMRFIDWSRGNPHLFVSADYDELMASDLLFARKFDDRVDPEIIERIIDTIQIS